MNAVWRYVTIVLALVIILMLAFLLWAFTPAHAEPVCLFLQGANMS